MIFQIKLFIAIYILLDETFVLCISITVLTDNDDCGLVYCTYWFIDWDRVWRRLQKVVLEVVIPTGRNVNLVTLRQGNLYSVIGTKSSMIVVL